MKGDTVLDYVEFELTPPRTRCDLFVSADNVTEKLASGFLKPFLMHLRAVEEQVTRGCNSVRLEHPQPSQGSQRRSWFTKGTLERFVRFVSTPEVLERVKSVEDELAQLEQVRTIQASSLRQAEDFFMGADSAASKADADIYSGVLERNGSSKLPKRYQNDVAENGAEASKIELLRAMDLRLRALKQEQSTAFGRAAAAGFNSKNMADLIAFSENFGADRLCTACINFLAVLKTRHAQYTLPELEAVSSGNSLTSRDEGKTQGPQVDVQEGRCQYEDDTNDLGFVSSTSKGTNFSSLSSRGSGGMEARKRWGPLENIRTDLYVDQNETDSNSSNGMSNGVSISGSPEVQSTLRETPIVDIKQEVGGRDGINAAIPDTSLNLAQGKNAPKFVSTGYNNSILKQSLEANVDSNGGVSQLSSSFERKSSLPLRRASIESSLLSHRTVSLQEPLVEKNTTGKDGNESHKLEEDVVRSETSSAPVVAPARRLSVQDAISLFENKQRRDSSDSSGKHRPAKQESNGVSSEGAGICSSGNSVLKRWDSGKGLQAYMVLPEYQLSSKPEAVFCPVHASEGGLGTASLDSTDMSQQRHGFSLAQPLSGSSIDTLSFVQRQPSVPNVSAKVQEGTAKITTGNQEYVASESVKDAVGGDWKKQFKLQLEKSLAKESSLPRDLSVKNDIQKNESGPILPKIAVNPLKCDLPNSQNTRLLATSLSGSRSKEALDEEDISVDRRQALPKEDTSGFKNILLASCEVNAEQNNLGFKKVKAIDIKKEGESNSITKLLVISDSTTDQSRSKQSLGSNPLNHDMQSLVTLADYQMTEGDKDPGGLKGRFYEQYRKLRDAKLLEDQDSKRAEREAKLKEMEETLTRRKAEMDARPARLSKTGANQIRATKIEALRADLHTPKKEQQDGGYDSNKPLWKDQAKLIISSASPPLTPYTSKEVASSSKPQIGKKGGAAVPQKGATPPRGSTRPTSSVSPRLVPRSTTAAGHLRKSVGSCTTDNPLARSVPCFANLRKENTKPSPGRPSGSARVHPKNGAPGRMSGVHEAAPLEANVNVPVRSNFSRNGPTKEDPKNRSVLLRKSCATASDFKILSFSSDDGVLAPLKGQRELKSESVAYNKLRRSTVGPFQEAKPFLRKGRGIGPGTGPGLMKQKTSSAADAAKSSDEEAATLHTPEPNTGDQASQLHGVVIHESNSGELSEVETMDLEDDAPVYFGSVDCTEVQAIDTGSTMRENSEVTTDSSAAVDISIEEPSLDELVDLERACHTISFPIDIKTHDRYAMEFSTQKDSNSLLDPDTLSLKEGDSEAVPQHEEHVIESSESQIDEVSTCLRTSSLPHEHGMPAFAPVPDLPLTSNVVQYDQPSPFSAVKLESPLGSPASWNSSQLQYSDVSQLNKKWVAYQKHIISSQPSKEPVRGFKRLLKFGRKSRASELATSDCISASTTSEGDDESEDHSRLADEVSSRGRLQERRYNDVPVDHFKAEEGSALNLRSSIPTPPADFRLRDDHMSGGSMLKAPRSFFSLSSFRSKGSEMKSR